MKFTFPFVFAASLSFSLITQAFSDVKVPSMFNSGPAALTPIKLKSNEITSLVLLESVMEIASLASLAGSCQATEGNYSIALTTDGAINKPKTNVVKITTPGNSEPLILNAIIDTPDTFRGQTINVRQARNSKLKETLISEYSGSATVNRELTLLTMLSKAKASGQNNQLVPYQNLLVKHFYQEQKADNKKQYILGWGLISLSKADFPVSQFWVQFKALKAKGQLNRVLLQQDRIVGTSFCRIIIDGTSVTKKETEKEKQKNFVLKGSMTITSSRAPLPVTSKF
jgi:hypothetical protein